MANKKEMLLNEWLALWLEDYKKPVVKPKTYEMYEYAIGKIVAAGFGERPVGTINALELQRMLNAMAEQGYSKSTISKVRLTLRQAYQMLPKDCRADEDPTGELFLPAAPVKVIDPLTHAEQDAVEEACRHDPLGHLVLFLLETGLRRNEMTTLCWKHYNATEHYVFIEKSKTPAGVRNVYLTQKAEAILQSQRRPGVTGEDLIFLNEKGGSVTPTVINKLIRRLRTASGVESLACHVCRHTFVTRLCELHVPAKSVAQIIGHASADYVLDIYAKMEANELRKAIYALERPEPKKAEPGSAFSEKKVEMLYNYLCLAADARKTTVDVLASQLLLAV